MVVAVGAEPVADKRARGSLADRKSIISETIRLSPAGRSAIVDGARPTPRSRLPRQVADTCLDTADPIPV